MVTVIEVFFVKGDASTGSFGNGWKWWLWGGLVVLGG